MKKDLPIPMSWKSDVQDAGSVLESVQCRGKLERMEIKSGIFHYGETYELLLFTRVESEDRRNIN